MSRGIGYRQFRILFALSESPRGVLGFAQLREKIPDIDLHDLWRACFALSVERDCVHIVKTDNNRYSIRLTLLDEGRRELERSPNRVRYLAEHHGDARQLDWTDDKKGD